MTKELFVAIWLFTLKTHRNPLQNNEMLEGEYLKIIYLFYILSIIHKKYITENIPLHY